jgi:hypothetical protein
VRGRQRHLWLAGVLGLTLVLQILLTPAAARALNFPFQGRATTSPSRPTPRPASQRLQEVPPPDWVQQLQGPLEERDPRVRILSPAAESVLQDGPWTLRLEVSDWPLVDAGSLGLGPHLVVQLDGQLPIPLVKTELEMPSLTPGSHLLTVYAAKPWGEAHKGPYALRQIRLHRLAENTATLPVPGTPQLVPVSPAGPAGDPPLLLDWLLLDAPLQGLRTDSLGWRLRVTLNGESVLLDRQTPLWLKGWRSGSNALLLELLDGRGELLNPPFNSVLKEVIVPGSAGVKQPHPGSLTELERAVLLGDQPVSALLPLPPPDEPVVSQSSDQEPPSARPPQQPALEPQVQEPRAQREEEQQPVPPLLPSPNPEQTIPSPQVDPSSPLPSLLAEQTPEETLPSEPTVSPKPLPEPQASVPMSAPQEPISSAQPSSAAQTVPPQSAPPVAVPAREEVNPDGTLKRAPRSGPLERLRQRWNR